MLNITKSLDKFLPIVGSAAAAGYFMGLRLQECQNNEEFEKQCALATTGFYLSSIAALTTSVTSTWNHFVRAHDL